MADDDFPDFFWQHRYQKRWIMYSDEHNDILNKALKKWQKTVTLPKKNLVINLEKMVQLNKTSLVEQDVRCIVYSDGFYSWLWLDDDEWVSYRPHIVCLLELAYVKKERIFMFFDEGDYLVDLETFKEVNEETNYSRNVQREQVEVVSKGMFHFAMRDEKFKKMRLNPSISFQKRWFNLPSSSVQSSMNCKPQKLDMSSLTIEDRSDDEVYDSYLPADVECPEWKDVQIFQENGVAFSATLNFVDISANSNKFCLIQLLAHKTKKKFLVWQRFGRVGTKGQTEHKACGNSLSKAKGEFERIFYDKTANSWEERKNFSYVSGKYDLLKVDLNPQEEIVTADVNLDPSIQSLLELICDARIMSDIMSEMFYDSTNAPLGKLTFRQITDGYKSLRKIAEVLSSNYTGSDLVCACEEFYMKIPHNFGKKSPPVLQTKEDIENKQEMLQALSSIRIAIKTLNETSEVPEHPLNRCYNSFKCSLELLDPKGMEFITLEKCLKETHGPTHSNFEMEVVAAYSCHLKKSPFKDYGNKYLLWHGSRITNWVGILKKGLRIAPAEAPLTGAFFGKGLYFADVSSKSANYCFPTKKNNQGLLLLCEVSTGKQHSLLSADDDFSFSLPTGHNSVFGKGQIAPKNFCTGILSSVAKAPFGPLVDDTSEEYYLKYNEYVVYDVNQVKMKYLLRIKFHFK
ncbi:poly polymerase 2 [Caerostris extrusa]|uniref:Poly [ADP-ribose] polymerase n=1 Tax=Caerostris extrusa TaxID=172846 RepID=A0AAV4Q0G6_CAEEX|nr:poly polymerase 2 [Caerostris extrusa]